MTNLSLAISEELHAEKYRAPGEDFREAMNRVASPLTDNESHFRSFRDILLDRRFLPAGRIQAAMGAPKLVTAINCFVSGGIEDNLTDANGIMQRASEAAITMRMGGGIGYDFSRLRPRGTLISTLQSRSSGPVSFMGIYDAVCHTIASSGHRRGAQMGVLRVDHPDIEEFIHAKQNANNLTGFNISIGVTDEFMRAVVSGGTFDLRWEGRVYKTIDARALWETIMRSTWDWAEPGVLFLDTINRMNNLYYCEEIEATNPCFVGGTTVWTAHGAKTFWELAEIGEALVLTQTDDDKLVYRKMTNIRCTQKNVSVIRVKFDDGTSVNCTENHEFFTKNRGKIQAMQLKAGDSIWSVRRYNANQKGYKRLTNSVDMPLEHHVPFDTVDLNGKHVHHINEQKNDNRPENLEVLDAADHNALNMVGDLNPMRRFPEKNHFANADFSGEKNGRYRHDIDDEVILELREAGLSHAAIAAEVGCSKYTVAKRLGWQRNHKVVSVEYVGETDVFCGTVEDTGRFFVDLGNESGILVSNCGEQPLPPFGACLLGSLNLVRYVLPQAKFNWQLMHNDIHHIVRAMDNVVDETIYPLPQQEHEQKMKRRLGLGVTGLANAGEALGFPYGSLEFVSFTNDVLRTLRDRAYTESALLAAEKGPFPAYEKDKYLVGEFVKTLPLVVYNLIDEYGIRNSHLTSIAPTGTISLTADNVSSGIEPVFSYGYDRIIQAFEGPRVEHVTDYGYREFGVRGKLTADCSAQDHLNVLLAAQKYVDSAVSKTCNVSPNMPWAEFKEIYIKAWQGGAKGITTFNPEGKRGGIFNTGEEGDACYIDPISGSKICGD